MNYCGPQGLPLSHFLAWDQEDQDAALSWSAHESRRYPDGTHPDDWDEERGGSRYAYHSHIDIHPGSKLIEAAQNSEQFKEYGRGAHVHLVRGSAKGCQRCNPQSKDGVEDGR